VAVSDTTAVVEDRDFSQNGQAQTSLSTAAARNLSTTTKSVPQMQEITSRWLLRVLPWVQVSGGVFRLNRRLTYAVGDGKVTFIPNGAELRVIPQELRELALLRDFEDEETLSALATRFEQREYAAGEAIVERGQPADQIVLIAHGKVQRIGLGKYDDETNLGVLADGDHFMWPAILETGDYWQFTARTMTAATVMILTQQAFEEVVAQSPALQAHIAELRSRLQQRQNPFGEAAIETASGHVGEPPLPQTFVDYEVKPREYELSISQTVLRVHTRVADLFNDPMDQIEQQLRLTVEALREEQESEMVNNRSFGLLHNAAFSQRIPTRTGPPTPDDFDEMLAVVRDAGVFLAHPRTIAAFGRECNRLGVYPQSVDLLGQKAPAWRGVPVLPCSKIPISDAATSSVLLMRLGAEDQGVIGLHQTGIPDEYQPSLNVRFMGIDEKAVINYLVTAYYSCAVLVPDALAVLEEVQIGLL
jgi:CRP-like cAMP-binding protein